MKRKPIYHRRTGRKIGLLSCTKAKKEYTCTARELYSESKDFRWYLNFAEKNYDLSFVVSARYGLVELTQLLNWYDRCLNEYTEDERNAWGKFIIACLRREYITKNDIVYIHANETYRIYLCKALKKYGIPCRTFSCDARPTSKDLNNGIKWNRLGRCSH
jgi:hypothetical protein